MYACDGPNVISVSSGYMNIGNYIHIGAYGFFTCAGGLDIDNFANISQGVRIYTVSDDYSGETMTNPMVPDEYKNVQLAPVKISKHAILGSGTIILPGVVVGTGCATGANSLVKKTLDDWGIYAGCP